MILERSDRRILAALRWVDATTGLAIAEPMQVQSPGVQLVRNASGYLVVMAAPGIPTTYTNAFQEAPATPLINSVVVDLTITDPTGIYLPRRYTLKLPRNPDPDQANSPDSLFRPVDVQLYRSPAAATLSTWAVLRATVTDQTNHRLPWALIRVTQPSTKLSLSQADDRGEALVAVPGIPLTTAGAGAGAVIANEVNVTLEIIFDPALQPIPPSSTGELQEPLNPDYLPDPDQLVKGDSPLRKGSLTYALAAGRDRAATLAVTLA
jgi:hypothetical protein